MAYGCQFRRSVIRGLHLSGTSLPPYPTGAGGGESNKTITRASAMTITQILPKLLLDYP